MQRGSQHRQTALRRWHAGLAWTALWCAVLAPGHVWGADKNGVSLQAVTLPSGPGSIRGLGEEFEPDLPNGTATYAIPFPVMAGTNDLAPELILEYDAGNGNGIAGFGWDLGLPFVARRDVRPHPLYDDTADPITAELVGRSPSANGDRFVSDEHGDPEGLVQREDGYYFGEREGAFIRYQRTGEHWEGIHPDGTLMRFGVSAAGRIDDGGARVFQWNIEEEQDTWGNTIRYIWESFPGPENLNQKYLTRIEYGAGPPPWDNFHMVVFEYETRPDWFEAGNSGFLVRTGMRLTGLAMATQGPTLEGHAEGDRNGDGITDYLNRRYTFGYESDPHWSLLSSVVEFGADGVSTMPTLTLEYTRCEIPYEASAIGHEFKIVNPPSVLFDRDYVELTDLNGDALPDFLRTELGGGLHRAFLNEGYNEAEDGVVFSDGVLMGGDERVFSVNLSEAINAAAYLADMNGNGRSDLVYTASPFEVYYFPSEVIDGLPAWGPRQSMNPFLDRAAPPSPFLLDSVEFGDVDGDDLSDVFQTIRVGNKTAVRVWLNEGAEFYAPFYTVQQDFAFLLGDDGVDVADINGDGLLDLVHVKDGSLDVAAGLGYGRFADPVMVALPELANLTWERGFDDLNGDGLDDLVVFGSVPGDLLYFLNLGNYTFSSSRWIVDLPEAIASDAASRILDLNGNGSVDLIIADRMGGERIRAVDLGACLGCQPAANMLVRVENGIGKEMRLRYETTTNFLLADRAVGRPWADPLPIVVPVVAEMIVEDGLGNLYNNLYTYHDGVYNTEFRMFVGFGEVVAEDVGDAVAPSRIDRFTYDVGRDLFLMRGNQLSQSVETLDGAVYYRENTEHVAEPLFTSVEGIVAQNVYEAVEEKEILEKGVGTPRVIRTERKQDAYGNEIELKEWGVYDASDPEFFADERITRMDYAYNLEKWIVRHPSRISIFDGSETLRNFAEFFYDDETFSAENLGEVTRGGQTMERGYYDVTDEEAYVLSDRSKYDAYGNVILELDELAEAPDGVLDESLGHYRRYSYDPLFHTFPESEEAGVGGGQDPITVHAAYDYGLGTVIESVDFSGNSTFYRYDPFGRLTESMRPGDQEGFPSLEYRYVQAIPFGAGLINYVETRTLDTPPGDGDRLAYYAISRDYMDGLGRSLGTWEEAEPDPETGAPRVAVSGAVGFHGRGGVGFTLSPHFQVRPGADLDGLLRYESIWDSAWTGLFQTPDGLTFFGLEDAPRTATQFDELLREVRQDFPDGAWREQRHEPLVIFRLDEADVDPSSPFFNTPLVDHSDGLGRLVQVDEVVRLDSQGESTDETSTWTTRYTYRPDGMLVAMEDALGNIRRYSFDDLQTLFEINDPNRGIRSFETDNVGNVIGMTDAAGRETVLAYDGVNRLLSVDYLDEEEDYSFGFSYDPEQPLSAENRPDVYYGYDTPLGPVDGGDGAEVTGENTAGQLAYVLYPTGEYHYSYTPRQGQAWTVHRMRDPLSGGLVSFKTEMENDPAGRVATMRYPDNDVVRFQYTARGLMGEVQGGAALHPGGENYFLRGTSYGPAGERIEAVYGNGVATSYRYDLRDRLAAVTSAPASDPESPLLAFAYSYDPLSNITAIVDGRPETVAPAGDARRNTQRYAYDDRERLIQAAYYQTDLDGAGTPDGVIDYRYNPVGNMVSMASAIAADSRGLSVTNLGVMEYGGEGGDAGRDGRAEGDPPGPQALTRAATDDAERLYIYDDIGNLIEGDGFNLVWDFEQRLAFIEDETMRAEYWYDYSGLRTTKQVWLKDADGNMKADPDSVVLYVGEHFEVREYDQITKYVIEDAGRVAKITGTIDSDQKRLQRFRIEAGWNFLSMAVEAEDSAAQLGACEDCAIDAIFLYDPSDESYTELAEGDALPAGSLFWLHAANPFTTTVLGDFSEGAGGADALSDGILNLSGFDALALADLLPEEAEAAWLWDNRAGAWASRLTGSLAFLADAAPAFVRPGQPVFLRLAAAADLTLPGPSSRVQYYHKDHLDSSSIIADGAGNVVEEIAYYPYGEPRVEVRASENALPNPYQFAEKERDQESKLSYFEARYLAPSLGRFLSADPLADAFPEDYLADPQLQHAYSFARSNPLVYSDPTGRIVETSRAQRRIKRLDPFGKRQLKKDGLTKAEKFGEVFGGLSLKKGDTLPTGPGLDGVKISSRTQKKLDKDIDKLTTPEKFISSIAQVAENLKNTLPQEGKGKIDVDQFLNLFTKERTFGPLQEDTKLTEGGREILSESEFEKKVDLKGFEKVLDKLDNLDDKFDELKGIADKALQKQEFKVDQKQVREFAKKFLGQEDIDPAEDEDSDDEDDE